MYTVIHVSDKRPMGHIAHLRKMFKSINTYDYIITLINRRKNPLSSFWKLNCSLFKQIWISFTQGCFVPILAEIGPVVLEKISKFYQCIFCYFIIISPWKRAGLFVLKNLNPLYPTTGEKKHISVFHEMRLLATFQWLKCAEWQAHFTFIAHSVAFQSLISNSPLK